MSVSPTYPDIRIQVGHVTRHMPTGAQAQGREAAVVDIAQDILLRHLSIIGVMGALPFKGGTALRKLYAGKEGRFSLDLDFSIRNLDHSSDAVLHQPIGGRPGGLAVNDTDGGRNVQRQEVRPARGGQPPAGVGPGEPVRVGGVVQGDGCRPDRRSDRPRRPLGLHLSRGRNPANSLTRDTGVLRGAGWPCRRRRRCRRGRGSGRPHVSEAIRRDPSGGGCRPGWAAVGPDRLRIRPHRRCRRCPSSRDPHGRAGGSGTPSAQRSR